MIRTMNVITSKMRRNFMKSEWKYPLKESRTIATLPDHIICATFGQFHQHFMHSFFVQKSFFFWQNPFVKAKT
jgi:hypothetical protein